MSGCELGPVMEPGLLRHPWTTGLVQLYTRNPLGVRECSEGETRKAR